MGASGLRRQRLAVFDLDHTLIRVDSFRTLLAKNLANHPMVILDLITRALGFCTREVFAERVHRRLELFLTNEEAVEKFVAHLALHVDHVVKNELEKRLSVDEQVILLSASPNEYVQQFALQMGFAAGYGSGWRAGAYEHLYGDKKLEFVRKKFPQDQYSWSFAISDSASDFVFLSHFEEHVFWKP